MSVYYRLRANLALYIISRALLRWQSHQPLPRDFWYRVAAPLRLDQTRSLAVDTDNNGRLVGAEVWIWLPTTQKWQSLVLCSRARDYRLVAILRDNNCHFALEIGSWFAVSSQKLAPIWELPLQLRLAKFVCKLWIKLSFCHRCGSSLRLRA